MTYDPPNRPGRGDPEVLPKGVIVRPSSERMPFGPSGDLLPNGPALPADFMDSRDVKHLPWIRERGQEWTTSTQRAEVLAFVSSTFVANPPFRYWEVEERKAVRSRSFATYPYPILVFRFYEAKRVLVIEIAIEFRTREITAEALAHVTTAIEAL